MPLVSPSSGVTARASSRRRLTETILSPISAGLPAPDIAVDIPDDREVSSKYGPKVEAGPLRALAERECFELVATQVVGRVAVVVAGRARVFPVNYVLDRGQIVFRTDEGTKLDAARAGATVTFQVDQSDPIYHTGWSVMAVGPLEAVTDPHDLARVRGLPIRAWGRTGNHWVRMPIASISGRRITGTIRG
jgi:hypothetical protein